MLVLYGAPQAVVHHRINQLGVAQAIAEPGLGQQIGRHVHVFHAAGNVEIPVAGADGAGCQHHGLQARATYFVDGQGADAGRKAAGEGGLAGRGLAFARLHHVAHDHFVDGRRVHGRACDRCSDGLASQEGSR